MGEVVYKQYSTSKWIYNLDFFIEHCIMAVAFFLPLSLDITSVFLAVGGFMWLVKMMIIRRLDTKATVFDGMILFFVIWSGFSIQSSPDLGYSSYNYFQLMSRYVLLYYLVVNHIHSPEQLKRVLKLMVLSSCLVSLYGFYQYFHGLDISKLDWVDDSQFPELKTRVFSTLHNPNLLAGFLVIMAAVTTGIVCGLKRARDKFFLSVIVSMLGLCLVFTYSRGAWISILVVIIIYSVFYSRKLFWLLLIIPLLMLCGQHTAWERVLSIFNPTDTSSSLRMALWESTLAMIHDKPLFGVGWGAYWLAYPDYDFYIHDPATTIFHAHNMYLAVAAETGIPGLLAFMGILYGHMAAAFKMAVQGRSKWLSGIMLGMVAAMASIVIGGMTDYILFNIQMSMLFWLINGLIVAAWRIHHSSFATPYKF